MVKELGLLLGQCNFIEITDANYHIGPFFCVVSIGIAAEMSYYKSHEYGDDAEYTRHPLAIETPRFGPFNKIKMTTGTKLIAYYLPTLASIGSLASGMAAQQHV